MAHEARVIEDLLHLDVLTFRAKYGIPTPEEEGLPGASDTSPRAAPHAAEAEEAGKRIGVQHAEGFRVLDLE